MLFSACQCSAADTAPAYLSSIGTHGAHQLDTSIYNAFAVRGERSLRLEVASYNVTNSVQYGYPNVFWNPQAEQNPTVIAGFSRVLSAANTPRQFHLVLALAFNC
jgi:hypothetical protein